MTCSRAFRLLHHVRDFNPALFQSLCLLRIGLDLNVRLLQVHGVLDVGLRWVPDDGGGAAAIGASGSSEAEAEPSVCLRFETIILNSSSAS